MTQPLTVVDLDGARRAHAAAGLLGAFAEATVLDAADVHVARALVRLAESEDDTAGLVALGIAFAVRAVRLGSVTVDLATIATTATVDEGVDIDVTALPWPDPVAWVRAVEASPLVAVGDDAPDRVEADARPVRLLGTRLALDRYWRHERAIVADVLGRIETTVPEIDGAALARGLARLFPDDGPDAQRAAAETAVRRSFSVIAGGPGTGKTTTVAAVLALLHEQVAAGGTPPRIALAAPTGKAAARLTEAVHAQALRLDLEPAIRDAILATEASTIHRLLGRAPGSNSRFRHDRTNQLPHQVVIIDETSMVSLSLMARLIEAVRPTARLVLVGDPQQLASVEAGAVLGDLVGPAVDDDDAHGPLAEGIVVLRTVHRFAGGIGTLARAIEGGDADAVVGLLTEGAEGVTWLDHDAGTDAHDGPVDSAVRAAIVGPATDVVEASRRGDAAAALAAMRRVQLLCAHRRGPHGVSTWRSRIEGWLTQSIDGYTPHGWYAGRPLLITANDYNLGLFNGDTGVVVATETDRLASAFERRGEIVHVSPTRLSAVETLYAMTIHKSQGSQFEQVVVILPDESSPILTRELLYTAVTRAETSVTLVATEASVRAAVDRPVSRASGLRDRLWP
ncbi:exodeoxyribonuclease V subunit alpha [Actinospongicola halichondriae]|uniref:exodeoxyribonuclease V subunit alpha n=1 Tax=Actinospongicola halichondriae TaxID=3236844 RepID=UPI003D3D5BBA